MKITRHFGFLLLICVLPQLGWTLDFGQLQVKSAPGQKLHAVLRVTDVSTKHGPVQIKLLTQPQLADNSLKLDLMQASNGVLSIQISSQQNLTAKFVSFLVVAQNAQVVTARKYSLQAQNQSYVVHATQPLVKKRPLAPAQHKHKIQSPAAKNRLEQTKRYPVRTGDNLWVIARRLADYYPTATFYQLLAGLYRNNPAEFIAGNIHQLKAGSQLKLPAPASVTQLNARHATEFVAQRLATTRARANPLPVTTSNLTDEKKQLRILTPPAAERVSPDTTSVGNELALVNQALEKMQRDNELLQMRIQTLQNQIVTLEQILAVRAQQTNLSAAPAAASRHAPKQTIFYDGWQLMQQQSRYVWALIPTIAVLLLVCIGIYLKYFPAKKRTSNKKVKKSTGATTKRSKTTRNNSPSQPENDSATIKLELAQAYSNLGDFAAARTILQEILLEGNTEQRLVAQTLFDKIKP